MGGDCVWDRLEPVGRFGVAAGSPDGHQLRGSGGSPGIPEMEEQQQQQQPATGKQQQSVNTRQENAC